MAEISGFFDSKLLEDGTMDRVYSSIDFATLFNMFFTNGVFVNPTNSLQVLASDGMNLTVKAGRAYIDGYWYELTEDMQVKVKVNSTAYNKISTVVCVLDKTNRTINVKVKNKVVDIFPINDGTIHELVLATISVGVRVLNITNADIIDRRFDNRFCGVVKGAVEQIDTTNLFEQFTSAFNEWFETIKYALDGDTAGNLLNIIRELETKVYSMPTIRSGTELPDNSVGKDGDIYIQTLE